MRRRTMRWISVLLVLVMLAELLPATLPGGMTARAAALPQALQPGSHDGPQETQHSLDAAIPATFIEPDSLPEQSVPLLPEAALPALAEDDLRCLALLKQCAVFSQLGEVDAAFFCAYTGRRLKPLPSWRRGSWGWRHRPMRRS